MAKMINTEAEQTTIQAALLAASMNFHDVVVYEDGPLKKAEFIQGSMHLTFTKTLKEGAKNASYTLTVQTENGLIEADNTFFGKAIKVLFVGKKEKVKKEKVPVSKKPKVARVEAASVETLSQAVAQVGDKVHVQFDEEDFIGTVTEVTNQDYVVEDKNGHSFALTSSEFKKI